MRVKKIFQKDLERRSCSGVKLTDQNLKIARRIIGKLVRQQLDIDEIQLRFMPGCGTSNAIFIVRELFSKKIFNKKYLAKKEEFVSCIYRFGESF